ncbi:YihY/virulence factor BrkB family protein [Fundicoccus sp. Sow4_F4]|uniref:YihY/virulence factor BrkB family protein n=1 Tax=Fundicoccus sp. Sow4_F4 TaxID=3438783 RepID=UPI003F9289EC
MEVEQPTLGDRLLKTFQVNKQQLQFGTYAAELSFYIIWAIVPIMLALANVIAILPLSEQDIIFYIERALPSEVETVLMPILESYLDNTSTGVFSLGLVISLWPASNVFNTLQRVLNTIYKAEPRKNFFLARGFAYAFTLAIVVVSAALSFLMIFGETVIEMLQSVFHLDLFFWNFFIEQGSIIALLVFFLMLTVIYYFIPNVNWKFKYALPGALFSVIGFILVSQLFNLYLTFASNAATSNSTIGVLIVVIIWLYFNAMVICIGAYINVFYRDFKEKSYWHLVEETTKYKSFNSYSSNFQHYSGAMPGLKHEIIKNLPTSVIDRSDDERRTRS